VEIMAGASGFLSSVDNADILHLELRFNEIEFGSNALSFAWFNSGGSNMDQKRGFANICN